MHHEQQLDTNGLCDILFRVKNKERCESTPLLDSSAPSPIIEYIAAVSIPFAALAWQLFHQLLFFPLRYLSLFYFRL